MMRMVLFGLLFNISVQAFSISSLPFKVLQSKFDCKMSVNNMNYYKIVSTKEPPINRINPDIFVPIEKLIKLI